MSLLTDYLRRLWVPGFPNVEADPAMTFSSWLREVPYYIVKVNSSDNFAVQSTSLDEITPLFAATSNKAFVGCFESIASINQIERSPRSVAWLLVKLYYEAFFAAHGQMRTCGVSSIQLDVKDAVRISEIADAYGLLGPVRKIESGQYAVVLDPTNAVLSFSKLHSGGSHEAMWYTYKKFLERAAIKLPGIVTIQEHQSSIATQLTNLIGILCFKGKQGGNWLSTFRNSIQYRQSHGAWYPYSMSKTMPLKLVDGVLSTFTASSDKALLSTRGAKPDDEVDTFYRGSMFLSTVARAMVLDLAARSTNPKAAATRGAVTFLRLCKLD